MGKSFRKRTKNTYVHHHTVVIISIAGGTRVETNIAENVSLATAGTYEITTTTTTAAATTMTVTRATATHTRMYVPDSDMDGDEDVLHADEVVDAPDAVV